MTSASISKLLGGNIVWDNHACMPLRPDDSFLPQLERFRKSGVNVVTLNAGYAEMPWQQIAKLLSFMRHWIATRPEEYRLVRTTDDLRQCKIDGKLGVSFDIEGMYAVQDDLDMVQTFYDLGVRWMAITYNRPNGAGGGCLGEDPGLSDVGRAIIDEMERVGMVLCLSHAGARSAAEALEHSTNPVIFSHSNPSGVYEHPRNISDELIVACARKGGVIGLNGVGPFLGSNSDMVQHMLRHLNYMIDLVGPDHVGISLDYLFDRAELDAFIQTDPDLFPPGLDTESGMETIGPESMSEIAEGLARMNLTDAQIHAILGENWLKIADRVWK